LHTEVGEGNGKEYKKEHKNKKEKYDGILSFAWL
jgi:hypothetical protein